MNNTILLYLFSGILAFIPAAIWLFFLFKKKEKRGIQILLFILSIFTVVPIFALQYFLNLYPQFDVVSLFESQISNENTLFVILFICVGAVEEIAKQLIIRAVDNKYLIIQTINESIRFSLIAALAFAFAENIFYFATIYSQLGIEQLIIPFLFRSIFTTCAHLIFSGFFGYFYGIAKFSLNIIEHSKWVGKKHYFSLFISRIFNMSKTHAFQELTIVRGLIIAITLHAIFNFLLQINQIIPVVIFVIVGYLILQHTLGQKAGKLILIADASNERSSTMARKDEDVVIELLGMWFKDNRYVDVMHICQRLLRRDPENKVIQLFRAKALDKMDKKNAYSNIIRHMIPKKGKKHKSIPELVSEKKKRKKADITPS